LPAPGQKYAPFGVVTVSSQVIARRIRLASDSDGDALEETEDLPTPAGVESRSRRSVIRKLAVSRSRATLATSAVVVFSTLALGDSAKRPRYATATTADSPSVQSVIRKSPLTQDSDIVRLVERLDQRFGARAFFPSRLAEPNGQILVCTLNSDYVLCDQPITNVSAQDLVESSFLRNARAADSREWNKTGAGAAKGGLIDMPGTRLLLS
jgi:hypothetical protein